MRLQPAWILLTLLIALLPLVKAEDGVELGMTREQVFRAFGRPPSRMENDDTHVLIYPHLRVTLTNGVVSTFTWLVPPEKRHAPIARPGTRPASTPSRPVPAAQSTPRSTPPVQPRPQVTTLPATTRSSSPATPLRPEVVAEKQPRKTRGAGFYVGLLALMIGGLTWLRLLAKRAPAGRRSTAWAFPQPERPTASARPADDFSAAVRRATETASASARDIDRLTPTLLRELEWKRFEELVCGYYNASGVKAECTCTGADGGVDVKLFRPGEAQPYGYVQCKSWFGRDAGVKLIRELFGVMTADQVAEGVFVTTSDFSDDAREFAVGKPLTLIDGTEFIRRFERLSLAAQREVLRHVTRGDYTTPTCVNCDVKMVLKNPDTGAFWGCPRYPRCHRTMKLRTA